MESGNGHGNGKWEMGNGNGNGKMKHGNEMETEEIPTPPAEPGTNIK